MSARSGILLALTASLGLAACGSSGSASLTGTDSAGLHSEIAAVRRAAARHDPPAATAALATFEQRVTQLAAAHKLDAADAQALLGGALRAQGRVSVDVRPRTATPTPPRRTVVAAPAAHDDHGDEHHGDHGGRDHGDHGGGGGGGDG